MLIKSMLAKKEKLNSLAENSNIEDVVSLEEIFNCSDNSFVKDALKIYHSQHKSMHVRSFIHDKIEQYKKERNLQLNAENENQILTYKTNSDLLLKSIIRFMKHAERENIPMLSGTTELLQVQNEFYINHCVSNNSCNSNYTDDKRNV